MTEIELDKVSKVFSGTRAVQEASFTIPDGEFFILVGPSGCGKSTLLNMIVGLESPSSGEIRVDGKRVNELDPKDRNMAMVFQSYAIYPHMSVRDNMAFPLKLAKLPPREVERRIARAAEILELGDLLERKPRALSGGQRQRVAMGRAIVREPKVFLLDEPLSNLDAKLRGQMRTELARLQRHLGTTTIYVTHDQTEAMTLGDRIAVMRQGEVQQVGTPRELYANPKNLFVASFIGAPAMNFLPARIEDGRLELLLGSIEPAESRLPEDTASVIVGFRPEHLQIVIQEQAQPGDLVFEASVDVIEWLGADLYVYFDIALRGLEDLQLPEELGIQPGDDSASLVARIDPIEGLKEGDNLRLVLRKDRLLLFDSVTGENLS
ncbi:MAG: sn-glycerol-3-phosphate ABC transporter ATP-binding protein UgpC [Gammaproteobacteria bacterium]